MLKLNGISKRFGGLHVLQDIRFDVPENSIFGLIGPNGAGKTTIINLITGLLRPDGGDIVFAGQHLQAQSPHHINRLGIARTFQNIRIFKEMTLLENVMVGMHAHLGYHLPAMLLNLRACRQAEQAARSKALELLSWFKLDHKAALPADNLSYGEQRKLELTRALATEPKLLLLDEPVAGMNPAEKDDLMEEMRNIKQRGYTIFMIEHDMRFVMELCERIAVLNFGKIIAQGNPEQVRNDPQVIDAYLGREEAA